MIGPIWCPKKPNQSRMAKFIRFIKQRHELVFDGYQPLHQWSIDEPSLFWQGIVDFFGISFDSAAERVLSDTKNMMNARWFEGASFNFAQKLLTHEPEQVALITLNEQGIRRAISFRELNHHVAQCAQGLKLSGVNVGSCVAALMPNVHYTVIAMLATASLGAIWASCSSEFGAQAAMDRIGQVKPTVLFIGDGYEYLGKRYDNYSKIVALSQMMGSLKKIIVCPILDAKWNLPPGLPIIAWNDFLVPSTDVGFVSLPFEHPLYILFSSGTTGKPKCIVHGAGNTLIQHVKELGLHCNITSEDILFFYTTCSWMMWNWMISVLSLGATLVLYEGSPSFPDNNRLFELIEKEQVTVFGTSAKFISNLAHSKTKPQHRYKLLSLKTILSTGSPLLPKQYDYVYDAIKSDVQLSSISGGSDIISCFALGNPMLPIYRGELQCLGLGMAANVFDELGQPTKDVGELVCTRPFPSMPIGLWQDNNKQAYHQTYFSKFANVWTQGDLAQLTPHHGLIICGRSDALLKPGGVRIGTAEVYSPLESIPEVLDCIAVGQNWKNDVRIVLFVKLAPHKLLNDSLKKLICQTIRAHATPRHVPEKILQVTDIPVTLSGKKVELAVKQVVHGEPATNLSSLANPKALDYFRDRKELLI